MHRLAFDIGPQLWAKRLVGDQVDRPAEQIFEEELDADVAGPSNETRTSTSLSARAASRTTDPKSARPVTPNRVASSALLAASCCSTCARVMVASSVP